MKKLLRESLLASLLLISVSLSAQPNPLTLSGKVIDKATQDPLPYATISLKEKPIGVVANQQG